MAKPRMSRKERIKRKKQKRQNMEERELFEKMCANIKKASLIPIIGDTVRNEHIFDVDFDDKIGIAPGQEDHLDGCDAIDDHQSDEEWDDDDELCEESDLSVSERLACQWADDVDYPLADRYQIARVAQYLSVRKGANPRYAKEQYLNFQKRRLIKIARDAANAEEDCETLELLDGFEKGARAESFSHIVTELDYPRFPEDKTDPLDILARLPIPIYLTTSYHDFMERALIKADKVPRTQLCLWNMQPDNLLKEHLPLSSFTKEEEAIKRPIVYHLYGLEQYPQSLVLSEDDYMGYLVNLSKESAGHSAEGAIPPYLEAALSDSSLVLLGYRLHDWDFRVLFRGLLSGERIQVETRDTGLAIQLDPRDQPEIEDVDEAKVYLNQYFEKANLRVHWDTTDGFVDRLWQEWMAYRSPTTGSTKHAG